MKSDTVAKELPERKLERSVVDFASTKTQMLLGAFIIAAANLVAYGSTLAIGILGPETLFLQSMAAALHGSFTLLQSNPQSLFFADYVLFHQNCAGYHCFDILLATVSAISVSLITLELTGRLGNRNGAITALWAGLLFSVYPLHAQTLAPVLGRIELLSAMFYLLSLFLFLRFRLIEEKINYRASLFCAAAALLCDPLNFSLAAVITAFALHPCRLPFSSSGVKNIFSDAIKCSAPYWLLTMVACVFLYLSKVGIDFTQLSKQSLLQIIMPLNQVAGATGKETLISLAPLGAALIVLLLKSVIAQERHPVLTPAALRTQPPSSTITCLILAAWLAATALTTNNNNNHLFLAAAPLAILISLCALESGNTQNRTAKILSISGLVALSALFISWNYLLTLNLKSYAEASKVVSYFRQQVTALKILHGDVLLGNLPQARRGLTARPIDSMDNLLRLMAPPFCLKDYSQNLSLLRKDYSADAALLDKYGRLYYWDDADSKMVALPERSASAQGGKIDFSTGQSQTKIAYSEWLKNCGWKVVPEEQWTAQGRSQPAISVLKGAVRLFAFDKASVLWLPFKIDRPLSDKSTWTLILQTAGAQRIEGVEVVSRDYPKSGNDFGDTSSSAKLPAIKPTDLKIGNKLRPLNQFAFDLRDSDSYMLSKEPQQLGLRLSAGQNISLTAVNLGPISANDLIKKGE